MSTNELQLVKGELRLVHWCTGGKVDCGTLNCSCFGGKVDCTSWALHWCSGGKVDCGTLHWCFGEKVDCTYGALHWCFGALQCTHWCKSGFCTGDPPCTASARLVPPMRRCRETTTSCHRLSYSAVKRQPGALHEKLDVALALGSMESSAAVNCR